MSILRWNLNGLFTEDVLATQPHDSGFDFRDAQERFQEWVSNPQSKIYSGYRRDLLLHKDFSALNEFAERWKAKCDVLLVAGIGGSSLGAQSVLAALGKTKEVLFLDNLDPSYFEQSLASLNLSRAALLIVSKSGGTIESLVNAFRVLECFQDEGVSFRERTAVVTTHGEGPLFLWADAEQVPIFEIPKDVGGRFSLFTPAGLLPLAFAGVNIQDLVDGAVGEYQHPHEELWRLALRIEELERAGLSVLTLWPYANVLFQWGRWFQQLWGESLGKRRRNGVSVGLFPAACVGANDQHSLLQFIMEGSSQCINAFVRVESWSPTQDWKVDLPAVFRGKLGFAQGQLYSKILDAEARATQKGLEEVGRPHFEWVLKDLAPGSLGALYACAMDLTVMVGALKDVNPFDQPGVETGKRLLPGVLNS